MNWFTYKKVVCRLEGKIDELKKRKAQDKVLIANLDKEIKRQDKKIGELELYVEDLGGSLEN